MSELRGYARCSRTPLCQCERGATLLACGCVRNVKCTTAILITHTHTQKRRRRATGEPNTTMGAPSAFHLAHLLRRLEKPPRTSFYHLLHLSPSGDIGERPTTERSHDELARNFGSRQTRSTHGHQGANVSAQQPRDSRPGGRRAHPPSTGGDGDRTS